MSEARLREGPFFKVVYNDKAGWPVIFQWVDILLFFFLFDHEPYLLLAAGVVNGVFNCNFWTIQRLLFVESIRSHYSGRNFGNYQIFVLIILKTVILLGGLLLEKNLVSGWAPSKDPLPICAGNKGKALVR